MLPNRGDAGTRNWRTIQGRRASGSPRSDDGERRARTAYRWLRAGLLCLAVGFLTACRPSEPLTVAAIQTGKSLNSDDSIATHSTSFRSTDTMHVAVLTAARGSGTISVRWKFGGQMVNEVTKEVSYNDQAATDFRFQTADGFPVGTYTIEVLLDGKPVGERTVRVE